MNFIFINIFFYKIFKIYFLKLYSNTEYYLFEEQIFTNDFVDDYFEDLNQQLENILGFTYKFIIKTYFINLESKKRYLKRKLFDYW